MERTRIKVCGITELEDAEAAVAAGADALGFIFVEKSARNIPPEKAREIIRQLPPFVSPVGVFVDEDPTLVVEIAQYCKLALVQLHGTESPGYCSSLPFRVIKSYAVRPESGEGALAPYAGIVQGFLLDTYHREMAGGTGKIFDWDLVRKIDPPGPVILAGGLSPENIEAAISQVRPFGVDVNSGVEMEPGRKDIEKLKVFIERVREIDSRLDASGHGHRIFA